LAGEAGLLRHQFLIETAKKEQLVLDPWAANGKSAELVIEPIWLFQTAAIRASAANIRVLIKIVQRIQDRVVLDTENAAMSGIAAGLGNDVYD
jgi:hypothetical protein